MRIKDQKGSELTIIMIAHRLETIKTAENLLYIASSTNVEKGEIGTAEYDALMQKLIETNYAHQ